LRYLRPFACFALNPCFDPTSEKDHNANNAKGRKQRKQTGTVGDHGANTTDRRRTGALVIHGGMTAQ
jgi:hypothetical protein